MLGNLIKELQESRNPQQAKVLQRFFKTGKGEYGEGDKFLGLISQQIKDLAKKYNNLPIPKIQILLDSKTHEFRVVALRILADKFKKSDETEKGNIFNFYLKNTKNINNWDLVDISAHKIVGEFLIDKKRDILYELAVSDLLWEKRISIVSCFAYIKDEDFKDALRISEMLLKDEHDLIHKAVGWVLREIGKKDEKVLEDFLKKHYPKIPRTTLRYAIEKFEENKRKKFLRGEF